MALNVYLWGVLLSAVGVYLFAQSRHLPPGLIQSVPLWAQGVGSILFGLTWPVGVVLVFLSCTGLLGKLSPSRHIGVNMNVAALFVREADQKKVEPLVIATNAYLTQCERGARNLVLGFLLGFLAALVADLVLR